LEDKRYFFSHEIDEVPAERVIDDIDSNKKKLTKKETKFYQVIISPSKMELNHISCSEKALMDYTRKLMDAYAKNFGKDLNGNDLVYYAKIEENRVDKKTKNVRPGLNWHVHVIVSRKDKSQKLKLSPLSNHRKGSNGVIKSGFDRNNLRQTSEDIFDQMFGYRRRTVHTFQYQNTMKNGKSLKEKITMANLAKNNTFKILGSILNATSYSGITDAEYKRRKDKNMNEPEI
ncbi:DUF5712 family protein, partial [Fulvivirga aurantia]|uniref:DUF5712 family protein n=1 Tax=Fulvivirga aurantia TaxID=2529383 RepID=UPI0016250A98